MVAGYHDDPNSGLPAAANGARDVHPGRVFEADQPEEGEPDIGIIFGRLCRLGGASQDPQTLLAERFNAV